MQHGRDPRLRLCSRPKEFGVVIRLDIACLRLDIICQYKVLDINDMVLATRRQDEVLTITLNRPERLNALNAQLRTALCDQLNNAAEDPRVRAIVLTGAGDRAFCAGQDLTESAALAADSGPEWMAGWRRYFDVVSNCPKPIVAAINGVAAGAGLQTALMGDVRIAVPAARLLMAEVNVGLPAIVGAYLLSIHLGLSRAVDLVLSGRTVLAEQAHQWGLVHALAEPEQLPARADAMARSLADKPPTAMRLTLANLRRALRQGLADAEVAAARYQSEAIATGSPQMAMERFLARQKNTEAAPDQAKGTGCTTS
jgi:enoyl-CoA hydratase/carnithine racemase